ncbi:MAG TPA: RNA polymerase sigma factor [Candidatus Kapabacteria bacterium]|jgi:RNA polymerase sigma-70 factor (ECF subfamily)|nr:RNA polymerase sigma factor [Candidatus Kapabacteria bacterium]
MLKTGPKPAQNSVQAVSSKERQDRFMQLLLPVQKRLEAFCFAMTRNEEEACDLVGETVLRAYEHFAQIRDSEAFLSYLFTIASRLHKRKRWRGRIFGSYDAESAEALPYGGTAPDVSADVEKLYDALAQLPDQQREAVVLYEISGLSVAEIQEIQGGSLSSVKMRLSRARKALATILGVDEPARSRDMRDEVDTQSGLSNHETHFLRFEAAAHD